MVLPARALLLQLGKADKPGMRAHVPHWLVKSLAKPPKTNSNKFRKGLFTLADCVHKLVARACESQSLPPTVRDACLEAAQLVEPVARTVLDLHAGAQALVSARVAASAASRAAAAAAVVSAAAETTARDVAKIHAQEQLRMLFRKWGPRLLSKM